MEIVVAITVVAHGQACSIDASDGDIDIGAGRTRQIDCTEGVTGHVPNPALLKITDYIGGLNKEWMMSMRFPRAIASYRL
jgi:hypothetical protein